MRKLKLRGDALLKLGDTPKNVHELSLKSKRSYPAVHDYINLGSSKHGSVNLGVLTSILTEGLGLEESAVLDLKVGDLFEFADQS
jgi:hypothetical protein